MENCKQARKHKRELENGLRKLMEEGSYPEMTNMLLSIHRSNQMG